MTTTLDDFDATDDSLPTNHTRRLASDLARTYAGVTHEGELFNFDAFTAVKSEAADALRATIEQEVDA